MVEQQAVDNFWNQQCYLFPNLKWQHHSFERKIIAARGRAESAIGQSVVIEKSFVFPQLYLQYNWLAGQWDNSRILEECHRKLAYFLSRTVKHCIPKNVDCYLEDAKT